MTIDPKQEEFIQDTLSADVLVVEILRVRQRKTTVDLEEVEPPRRHCYRSTTGRIHLRQHKYLRASRRSCARSRSTEPTRPVEIYNR